MKLRFDVCTRRPRVVKRAMRQSPIDHPSSMRRSESESGVDDSTRKRKLDESPSTSASSTSQSSPSSPSSPSSSYAALPRDVQSRVESYFAAPLLRRPCRRAILREVLPLRRLRAKTAPIKPWIQPTVIGTERTSREVNRASADCTLSARLLLDDLPDAIHEMSRQIVTGAGYEHHKGWVATFLVETRDASDAALGSKGASVLFEMRLQDEVDVPLFTHDVGGRVVPTFSAHVFIGGQHTRLVYRLGRCGYLSLVGEWGRVADTPNEYALYDDDTGRLERLASSLQARLGNDTPREGRIRGRWRGDLLLLGPRSSRSRRIDRKVVLWFEP